MENNTREINTFNQLTYDMCVDYLAIANKVSKLFTQMTPKESKSNSGLFAPRAPLRFTQQGFRSSVFPNSRTQQSYLNSMGNLKQQNPEQVGVCCFKLREQDSPEGMPSAEPASRLSRDNSRMLIV